ncbi:MAG: hypothetical protein ACAI44_18345 [Candidatus Sericytochromatia bacterium]
MNMNIQGIKSSQPIQVRQIQPGKLEEIKKAADDNNLDELIIENDKGTFLIYAKDLAIDYEYADNEGVMHRTVPDGYAPSPKVGDRIILGDLKGKVAFFDDETDRRAVGGTIGGVIGGFAGFIGGAAAMSDGSRLGDFLGVFLGGGPGAAVGALVGMGAGYGLTHLLAKPTSDPSGLERLCLPPEQLKVSVANSNKL